MRLAQLIPSSPGLCRALPTQVSCSAQARNPRVRALRFGRRPAASEDDQGVLGEKGVPKAVPGGLAGTGDHPRRWRVAKVLEGHEGAGGGGAAKEDVGRRDGDSGKG